MENQPFYTTALIFISIVLIFTLIFPQYQKLSALKEEKVLKENEFQAQEKYFQDIEATAENLKQYETSLSKIDDSLPSEPYPVEFLNFIQKASSQSGLLLKEISLPATTAVAQEKLKESRVSLVFVGDYARLKNFLSVLENSARIIDVENVSFTTSEKEKTFTIKLALKFYSY